MNKGIAIAGCGWLGLPLARAFLAEGYRVHGSTTSPEKMTVLEEAGIQPFLIRLDEHSSYGPLHELLSDVQCLVINIPPGLRSNAPGSYIRKMQVLRHAVDISGISHVLFISSTSVYGNAQGVVTENSPTVPNTPSGREVLEAEMLFRTPHPSGTTVIRFGGLIGPDRHPVTHLAGKKDLSGGTEAINLIHRDDCIQLIQNIVRDGVWGALCNGVYPAHPGKEQYYVSEALARGLPPPQYSKSQGGAIGKRVVSTTFLANNYSFYTSIFKGFTTENPGFTTKK